MLEVKDLNVQLGTFHLTNINFEVKDQEYFVLLGPTGSGKSVLLETIAGLKPVNSGKVIINGRDVTDLNLEHRKIGFAFQDYALYRHMSVRDNISFGLMWKKMNSKETEKAVDNVIELLGISNLLDRHPWNLSGGESQKIALARAIAIKPDLLILDEPLSAVDSETKEDYERDLKQLHKRLGLTTMHVTHSHEEAMALGERIAVMQSGSMVQLDTPEGVFRRPQTEFVARFLMSRNIFKGEIVEGGNGYGMFAMDGLKMNSVTDLRGERHASVRPEDILISITPPQAPLDNTLQGTVSRIADRGSAIFVTVDTPHPFTSLILRRTLNDLQLQEGSTAWLTFSAADVNIF